LSVHDATIAPPAWTLKDKVRARGKHPWGRPERRSSNEAYGTLYPEFYARVFAHIAAKLDAVAMQHTAASRPVAPPRPSTARAAID
jgi:hypothetical protein